MMAIILVAIGLLLCILGSAFFSSGEMGYSSCNKIRLENEAESGSKPAKRALQIAEHFEDALSAILIGNNLVNIAASALTSVLIILITGQDKFTWVGTVIITVLIIIFGETIPKIVSKKRANTVAMNYSGLMTLIIAVLRPVSAVVLFLVRLITGRIKEGEAPESDESVEEFQSIIETAEDEGVLDKDRTELLQAAIDFSDISASEAMTARVDLEAIDIDDDLEEMLEFIENTTYSRIPVYEDSIDNIIGVLHQNHLLKALSTGEKVDIRSLLMKPCFVYKTMKLPEVLNTLRRAKQHLAVVTDEYSGTLGVITMEDVLEEIVGDIWDDNDEVEEEVVERGEDLVEIDGDMSISGFLELLDMDPDETDYESETAGGWTIEYLGHYPSTGEEFDFERYHITVTEADDRRVEKLLVEKTDKEEV